MPRAAYLWIRSRRFRASSRLFWASRLLASSSFFFFFSSSSSFLPTFFTGGGGAGGETFFPRVGGRALLGDMGGVAPRFGAAGLAGMAGLTPGMAGLAGVAGLAGMAGLTPGMAGVAGVAGLAPCLGAGAFFFLSLSICPFLRGFGAGACLGGGLGARLSLSFFAADLLVLADLTALYLGWERGMRPNAAGAASTLTHGPLWSLELLYQTLFEHQYQTPPKRYMSVARLLAK